MPEKPRKQPCRSCGTSTPVGLVDGDGDCVNCIVLGRKKPAKAKRKEESE